MITTSQNQLKAGFWKVHRHNDNRYYIHLHQIINRTIYIDQVPPKCKYCKAYPFQQLSSSRIQDKQCQLCGSINQKAVKLQNAHHFVDYNWYSDHSYIYPLKNKPALKSVIILALDPMLDQASSQMLYEGLKISLGQQQTQQYGIIVLMGPVIGVLNLSSQEQPQMITVSQQVSAREIIEKNTILLQRKHIDQLQAVMEVIKNQKKPNNLGYQSIFNLMSKYKEFQYNCFSILLLIGPAPQNLPPFPPSSLYLIAIFTTQQNFNYSNFFELKNAFHQLYLLAGQDQPTKLYYKIYQLIAFTSQNLVHRKSASIRSNHLYSGTIQNQPHGLITSRSALIQVTTTNNNPHFLQLQVQYFDKESKQWLVLVANLKDKGAFRSQAFEKCILASKALQYLIIRQKKINQLSYSSIRLGIEQYGERCQNATNYMQSLLHHLQQYFKEYQKQPEKLIAPFEYIGTILLLPVFWPILLKKRTLYYCHGYYSIKTTEDQSEDAQEVENVNQMLQRFYTSPSKKFDYFYRICLDVKAFTVLQNTN